MGPKGPRGQLKRVDSELIMAGIIEHQLVQTGVPNTSFISYLLHEVGTININIPT